MTKLVKKNISFDHETHAGNVINSYHPWGGIIQTVDGNMLLISNEDKEKLNKYLEEFLKTARFKQK